MTPRHDPQAIVSAFNLIIGAGNVTELRALDATVNGKKWSSTYSGYFDNADALVAAVTTIRRAKGIYIMPNPVNGELLARASNKIKRAKRGESTQDGNISRRRWFLIDIDAQRPSGISATDAEHEAAIKLAREIHANLRDQGWTDPIAADSGNGGHLLYRIDLPTEDDGLVQRCLTSLARRFDGEAVKVDQTVFNPARIWKLYGTLACKGDSTPDRPHRMARILKHPAKPTPVPMELLVTLADQAGHKPEGAAGRAPESPGAAGEALDLEAFIHTHNLDVTGPKPWTDKHGHAGKCWVFNVCPWNTDHTNLSAHIIQFDNGAIAAGCHHNGCAGKDWYALRDAVDPGWRDQRDSQTKSVREQAGGAGHMAQLALWPEAMGDEAYYGLVGEIVRLIEPHTEADPHALLVQSLQAVGSAAGRSAHFKVEGDQHYCNLFSVQVGETSKGRKGTSWGQCYRVLKLVDDVWATDRVKSGLSSGEGLIWEVRDPIMKRDPIKEKGRFTGEYNEYESDPGVEDKRLLVVEAEFASTLRVMRREGNILSPVVRAAWDTGRLNTMVKNNPATATNAHISIIGHNTRDELRREIDATDQVNGFANRFLWVCVKRSKCLPERRASSHRGFLRCSTAARASPGLRQIR